MNPYKVVNLEAYKNATKLMQPYNQPKHENTLARLIE
jgi:hypothetical protein